MFNLTSLVLAALLLFRADGPKPTFIEPSFSPDRSEIVFASGGDIWSVSAKGGEARLLVSNPSTEGRPLFSPDGTRLAFISNRTGNGDIYVLTLASGELKRLTYDDANDQLDAWSRDGKWLYFTSSAHDIGGMNDVYRMSAEGGTPMAVAADRYATEYWGAPSPDGKAVAITARGTTSAQWWRKGHSHLDESEIWLVTPGATPVYRRLSEGDGSGKDLWAMWSADGQTIYFMSDRSGAENIWKRAAAGGAATQVTHFKDGRLLWPQISLDGKAITFERNFGVWTLDVASGDAKEVPIVLRGVAAGPETEHLTLTTGAGDLALSPDGRKIAFVMHGEIFAASSKDGGEATRVTTARVLDGQIVWAPDSRRIAYASDRDGPWHVYVYDFVTREERRLAGGPNTDIQPAFSPDGRSIAFLRDAKELHVYDLTANADRTVATGRFDRPPFLSEEPFAFAPDGKWLAYLSSGERGFTNAWVVPSAGGESHEVSFTSNSNGGYVRWSPDAKYLLQGTSQRTETREVLRIDLVPRAPVFHEDQFRNLFPWEVRPVRADSIPTVSRDSGAAAPRRGAIPATEIVFDGIRERATSLPLNIDVGFVAISPDGKTLLVTAGAAGQINLWTWSLDETSPAAPVLKQITSSPGGKARAQFSPDGREAWYTENGRVSAVNLETRAVRTVPVTAELDVDFAQEKMEVFHEAWSYLRDNFFDEKMHGANWAALGDEYRARVAGARTRDEMRRLLNLMIGELNASHSGAGGAAASPPYTGRIGATFDRTEYEASGRFRISEIVPFSPLALAKDVKVGDYLRAVDGVALGARSNLDEQLSYKTGRRVTLSVSSTPDGAAHDVAVRPISGGAEKNLLYRAWVESRRAYVAKVSGGKLGYVHMFDMGAQSLAQLYVDLDAENQTREGVVVDVRNNTGGFVNAYAIDVFARRGYMTMQSRGELESSARTALGQRSLEKPTILVTNQHSLSDAEDFTEGYRTLKLGKVVGEPTAGWIIYTSNVNLLDGTSVRLPGTRIRGADGKDMEMSPRPVDVTVVRPIGEWYSGRDSQLDEAVKQLLAQIKR
jgi:tricorn protease